MELVEEVVVDGVAVAGSSTVAAPFRRAAISPGVRALPGRLRMHGRPSERDVEGRGRSGSSDHAIDITETTGDVAIVELVETEDVPPASSSVTAPFSAAISLEVWPGCPSRQRMREREAQVARRHHGRTIANEVDGVIAEDVPVPCRRVQAVREGVITVIVEGRPPSSAGDVRQASLRSPGAVPGKVRRVARLPTRRAGRKCTSSSAPKWLWPEILGIVRAKR